MSLETSLGCSNGTLARDLIKITTSALVDSNLRRSDCDDLDIIVQGLKLLQPHLAQRELCVLGAMVAMRRGEWVQARQEIEVANQGVAPLPYSRACLAFCLLMLGDHRWTELSDEVLREGGNDREATFLRSIALSVGREV